MTAVQELRPSGSMKAPTLNYESEYSSPTTADLDKPISLFNLRYILMSYATGEQKRGTVEAVSRAVIGPELGYLPRAVPDRARRMIGLLLTAIRIDPKMLSRHLTELYIATRKKDGLSQLMVYLDETISKFAASLPQTPQDEELVHAQVEAVLDSGASHFLDIRGCRRIRKCVRRTGIAIMPTTLSTWFLDVTKDVQSETFEKLIKRRDLWGGIRINNFSDSQMDDVIRDVARKLLKESVDLRDPYSIITPPWLQDVKNKHIIAKLEERYDVHVYKHLASPEAGLTVKPKPPPVVATDVLREMVGAVFGNRPTIENGEIMFTKASLYIGAPPTPPDWNLSSKKGCCDTSRYVNAAALQRTVSRCKRHQPKYPGPNRSSLPKEGDYHLLEEFATRQNRPQAFIRIYKELLGTGKVDELDLMGELGVGMFRHVVLRDLHNIRHYNKACASLAGIDEYATVRSNVFSWYFTLKGFRSTNPPPILPEYDTCAAEVRQLLISAVFSPSMDDAVQLITENETRGKTVAISKGACLVNDTFCLRSALLLLRRVFGNEIADVEVHSIIQLDAQSMFR